ncbi:glycoside hydrolase family 32 protein [Megamonas funiformis]|uniref:glycoside hydrolase family 32 protein n=1 Tax=Megamonas funiformis TaxID=437897 RepID=UPI00195CC007|nr:glycoside hydrolase family 32 protein [Megamonas funiformis]MBM6727449.1 glycoside hydrolase family 32 protein [Megamonas funiformis]
MQWHNKFHLEMPKGLVNDPNGLCYHQGKYQIFFQWNPFGCEHKHKHWAYTQTTDFINYTKPQIALAPIDKFDKDGCYSGSARNKNNKLEIIYTANLKDEQNIRYPRQVLVKQNDDGEFIKEKIIIDTVPEGYTTHFRDPYIFAKNNRSFIILGAQRENLTGCALIYEEIDENWIFRGELKTQLTDFGYMWECPNLFTIDDKDILVFCPQGLKAQKYQYQNLYQAGYLIGQFNPDTLEFTHGEFHEFDMGFDFYAPQVLIHENRHILIGWVGMPDKLQDYPTINDGWVHSLTLPRELILKNDKLYQRPISELNELNQNTTTKINTDKISLSTNKKLEISIPLKDISSWQGKLKFNDEYILLTYDKNTSVFTIDRNQLKLGGKGIRQFLVKAQDELNLSVYIDNSIIELYLQDGKYYATFCYYLTNDNPIFDLIQNTNNCTTLTDLNSISYL